MIPEARCKAWADIGRHYLNLFGDHEDALRAADKAIRALPQSPYGYGARALILRDRDGVAAAHDDCVRMAGLPLTSVQEYADRAESLRGYCLAPELALVDLDRAVVLAPRWGEAYRRRAQLHRTAGRFDAALSDLGKAIELTRSNGRMYYERGEVLADMERYEDALRDLERGVSLGLGVRIRPWTLANVLSAMGRDDEALRVVDRAIATSAFPESDWRQKANTLRHMGRVDEAAAAADKALQIRPDIAFAHEMRADIAMFRGEPCATVGQHLRKAIELGPDAENGGQVSLLLGAHVARVCPGEFDAVGALRLAERAVRSAPQDPDFRPRDRVRGVSRGRSRPGAAGGRRVAAPRSLPEAG